nr:MAG TPA: hypothetical protein [Caudoviricetes sp.]
MQETPYTTWQGVRGFCMRTVTPHRADVISIPGSLRRCCAPASNRSAGRK